MLCRLALLFLLFGALWECCGKQLPVWSFLFFQIGYYRYTLLVNWVLAPDDLGPPNPHTAKNTMPISA